MKQTLPKYEQIEHTADVGIKIYGVNLPELFANAALGLFDIITNLEYVQPDRERFISVEASDREALLVTWLSELNYQCITKGEVFCKFEIQNISDTQISALVKGERIDKDRHEIYTEVKAVTYHQLYIKQIQQGWEAQVIFDL